MVKAKRNKKEDGHASDAETRQTQVAMDSDNEQQAVVANNKKPAAKKGKKDEPSTKKAAPKKEIGSDDDDEDVDDSVPVAKSKGKGKKGGFALLQVEDDDNDMLGQSQSDDDESTAAAKKKPQAKAKGAKPAAVKKQESVEEDIGDPKPQQGKKGKKDKRRNNKDEEEDIEKLLAELEIEYSGGKVDPSGAGGSDSGDEDKKKKAPAKGSTGRTHKKSISKEIDEMLDDDYGADMDNDNSGTGMKSAAQKKREKKERQRLEKLAAKASGVEVKAPEPAKPKKEETPPVVEPQAEPEPMEVAPADNGDAEGEDGAEEKKSKKKKGKKDKAAAEEEKADKGKKGPNKALVAAMQERLKKLKEDEEKAQREEEERIRLLEEADRIEQEQLRQEAEKKEKKKQKEKERKERLKAEGKLLTKKQQADRARAQAMLESLKAQGLADVPGEAVKKTVRLGTRIRPKKDKSEEPATPVEEQPKEEEKVEVVAKPEKKPEDDVKDSWDASSSEDEAEDKSSDVEEKKVEKKVEVKPDEDSDSEEEDSEDESDSDDEDSDENDQRTDAEKKRDRAKLRISKRREEAEKHRSLDVLRAPVVCVLGHVDTGKTKILDKLRRTNVQDGEAGGITQQIGATNVPIDNIKEQIKIVKNNSELEHKLPGLLIIDTPGHESFSNLRNRGSSLCDIAILVVDIMHGLEPQTIESLNLLKQKKTPFLVALNKIDRLYDWETMPRKDVRDALKAQQQNTQLEFKQRTQEVINQFAMQGLNAKLFYENPDVKTYISLVPTSAITGEGMGNLLYLICEFSQNMLAKRLMFSEELQATVLEVKAIPGLGTTIDAILINGRLREGETMILAGTDGPITTQIRSLLMPQPMKELRVKNAYIEHKEVQAAQGVKLAAKDLEKAIAGLNLLVAQKPDEVELLREEVARELKSALSSIKLSERGVFVQASTLGSLEALLEFLKSSKIPYAGIRIGPVVKRDVMKASTMLEHDKKWATILAFDVKVERDAQELADTLHVKIFQADIIYHLFDKFIAYQDDLKQKKRDEFKQIAVFPCKLKILPQFIFNSRDPIVMGVIVENGILKEGTPICVPSKSFVYLGIVTSIESNHKQVDSARKGQEVCIKIENVPGETPKLFGRHFDETDMLISKISRQSIDACKEYFRDDLIKADWALMVELKKLFEIL